MKSDAKMTHDPDAPFGLAWALTGTIENGEEITGRGCTPGAASDAFNAAKKESLAFYPSPDRHS